MRVTGQSLVSDLLSWLRPVVERARVRAYRARLRSQGLRPIQIWIPDVNAPGFAEEAHRQSRAVAVSSEAEADQAFVDLISEWPED